MTPTTPIPRCPVCGWEHPPAYPFSPLDGQAADAAIPTW